jgi:nucleoid-associated protein YgaU
MNMKTRLLMAMLAAILLSPLASAEASSADPHLARAIELRGQAGVAYDAGDYDAAAELARKAKAELGLVKAGRAPLPASYTVRLIPGDRDCLSKIAGYSFVYGDREEWVSLYMANKDRLKHPENADLVLPGEVILIPSLYGENRSGEWDPKAEYPIVK